MNRNYYELTTRFDARKSFGGKALVKLETVDGVEHKTLISYGHEVVRKRGDNVSLTNKWDFSSTTLRHVKEFPCKRVFQSAVERKSKLPITSKTRLKASSRIKWGKQNG